MNRLARKKYQCSNNQSVNNSDVGKPTWDKDKIKQTKNNCPWRRFAEAENYTLKKQIFSNARRSERFLVPRFFVCSARALSNGCKSRVSPNSGNYIAKGKGVHRELESERSRRQTSDLTNWNFIQGIWPWVRLLYKPKPYSYSERSV